MRCWVVEATTIMERIEGLEDKNKKIEELEEINKKLKRELSDFRAETEWWKKEEEKEGRRAPDNMDIGHRQ